MLRGLVALLLVVPPLAGRQLDTLLVLPSVTVSAGRTAMAIERAPARVTLLDSLALSASAGRSVAEVLEAKSPASIRRYGSSGLASVSLRGTSAAQTLVVLDGQPIANPQLGQVDLSLVPLVLLEAVEVRQGGASSDFGAGALGGVVHLRSLQAPGGGLHGRVRMHGGAFGRREVAGVVSAASGGRRLVLAADLERDEGDFPLSDAGAATREPLRRTGADRAGHSVFGSLSAEGDGIGARLSAWTGRTERGLPGPSFVPPAGERQWDRELRVWTNAWAGVGRGQIRAGALAQRLSVRYVHPILGLDETGTVDALSGDAEVRQAWGSRHVIHGGVAGGIARVHHPSITEGAREYSASAFMGVTSEWGAAMVYPSVRFDRFVSVGRSPVHPVSPSLGVNLGLGRHTRLKAQIGRSFRMPTLNDRFWVLSGNPDLEPETGWSGEVGMVRRIRQGEAEVTVFRSAMENRIQWVPAGEVWRPVNLDFADILGVEVGGRIRSRVGTGGRFDAGGSYEWIDARHDSGHGRVGLRYVPRHQARAFGDIWWRRLFGGVSLQVSGSRFLTEDRSESVSGYAVVDLRVGGTLFAGTRVVTARLVCENALDARYAVIRGYPMPPRHLGLQVDVSF